MRKQAVTATEAMGTDEVASELFPASVLDQLRSREAAERRPDKRALRAFRSEEKCRAYLEQLRWPRGVSCPRCDATKGISRLERRGQFDCNSCGYQFSVRVGTVLQDSQLPLWKWVLAALVMAESPRGISANQLRQILGVSYKTAWYLSHRIRSSMRDEAAPNLQFAVKKDGQLVPEDRVQADTIGHLLPDLVLQREGGTSSDSMWTALQRSVSDSYYHLSAKHLPAYVDEAAFRHKNRDNDFVLRDILLRLVGAGSMSYAELVAGS